MEFAKTSPATPPMDSEFVKQADQGETEKQAADKTLTFEQQCFEAVINPTAPEGDRVTRAKGR
jgi:hypothetical protein